MKTLVLNGIRKIEMIDRPQPKLKNPDDVLIRIKSVGVCGSDVHYFSEGKIGSQVVEFPFTVGHECSGLVVETGISVTRVKPGDLVAIDPSIHCGICDQCLAGRPHTCRNNLFLGCPGQIEGCLAEFIVMPEFTCFVLNDSFNQTTGALIEPLTIGVYSVELANTNFQDKTIGIFGAGPIGLSVLMVLKTMQTGSAFCFEPLEYRREKALKLGSDFAFNPFETDAYESTRKIEPLLLDVVFECSGTQKAVDDAIKILKPGGKLVLVGIPPEAKYVFNMDLMRRKEISIQNVRRQNHCVEKAIKMIEQGLPAGQMVTHHFLPEETQQAFEMVSNYQDGVIKAMIDFA
ncbi:MAG TPA: alcohol dehydrogenase catalytic domain-containing protein [Prolixibacteraceae bacterium]|nr:alcohol dehydrogenase catalytic domain-containing protein [Prolixibacteraceae bacterium]